METLTLLRLAETYAGHLSLKLSTVSTYVRNDGKFFDRMKTGSGCTLKTAAAVVQWFADNWPDDLTWPRDIARPAKSKRAA
ncbi:MAG: hypothetical protein EAZ40_11205 [Rhodobacterales bacterium]|nr:MAG: hypothetical protein EAZ40_11205 [Rhodobacterales bacterium]